MTPQDTAKADCYSANERGVMEWTQKVRAALFRPLLIVAQRIGILPDHITLASLLCGLAFCPLYFARGDSTWLPAAALAALLAHLMLDGLDGPLARHLGTASRRGSFTDTLADQIVVTATTITLMAAPEPAVTSWIGALYLFVYATVVGFAMVRNTLGVPYSWLIRPRFWVYGWIAVDLYLWPGQMDGVMGMMVILLSLKLASGFVAIRRML